MQDSPVAGYVAAHADDDVCRFVTTGRARVGLVSERAREERRRVGEVMGPKHGGWTGDPEIGLTKAAWVFDVPALVIGERH